ncbi:MAG: CpaF family protein [Lachnospiraceae bacterium]|nr:CpaF family protein [Lachnospiraceae bacterium]
MDTYAKVKEQLYEDIRSRIDFSREVSDDEVEELIDELIIRKSKTGYIKISDRVKLRTEIFYSIRKLDILQELVDDNTVTEIMINGPDNIFIEKEGRLFKWDRSFESAAKLLDVIQQIVAKCNRVVNESSPIVDARLQNGSRVNVVLNPVALNGPILTIRRFPEHPITMDDLISFGAITKEAVDFLQKLVVCGYNIFISGGTGSGKTTFLNALSNFIPKDERVITIEDSAELQILGVENLVRLETRNANVEGCDPVTIRDLIKSSLRMRPDRIIVGEVRGGEALDLLSAMNTGHDGSLSTGHANSARDMMARLETMVLMGIELPLDAIRRQISSGIDILVHLGRLRDKSRRVLQICEMDEMKDGQIQLHTLYTFKEEGESNGKIHGSFTKVGELKNTEKLKRGGLA